MCLAVVLVAWLLPVGVSWVINMFAQVAGSYPAPRQSPRWSRL